MTTPIDADARRMYTLLADGGLALARTNTGYGLVAMRSDAVRRIYALKGRSAQKPCVTVGTMAILDDVARGVDPETRGWLARAVAQWPMAVIARTNPRVRAARRASSPSSASQCTKADTIATFFGVGELIARTATIAYGHGQLIVGSSANLAGTGNNYTLDAVPDVDPPRRRSGARLRRRALHVGRQARFHHPRPDPRHVPARGRALRPRSRRRGSDFLALGQRPRSGVAQRSTVVSRRTCRAPARAVRSAARAVGGLLRRARRDWARGHRVADRARRLHPGCLVMKHHSKALCVARKRIPFFPFIPLVPLAFMLADATGARDALPPASAARVAFVGLLTRALATTTTETRQFSCS